MSPPQSLNSRIRFSIEEVIELRRNGWRARREQEGPARLEQIHQKAAQVRYSDTGTATAV
jgi:translation initiation factor 4G